MVRAASTNFFSFSQQIISFGENYYWLYHLYVPPAKKTNRKIFLTLRVAHARLLCPLVVAREDCELELEDCRVAGTARDVHDIIK